MRNLFSFFGGLCSGLLYGLIHLVLLLDRLIGAFCGLPIWQAGRQALGRVRKKRVLCALAVFVPVFIIPSTALLHSGTLVTVNGRPLGMVEDGAALFAVVRDIEERATDFAGAAYRLPLALGQTETRAAQEHFLSADELEQALIAAAPDLDTLAVIEIDGQQAGVCRSAQEAQTLLDRIKAQYTTAADGDAQFLQAVRVDSVTAPLRCADDFGALYQSLAPRLDVRATRAVTYTEHIPYQTITRENDQLDQTYRATVQQGCAGEALVTAEIETVDGQEHGRTVRERTVLRSATDEIIEVGTKNIGIGTGEFQVPLSAYTFTSAFKMRWGRLHGGVDLAVPEGTPVYAADNGKVILAETGDGSGYGSYIILDHQNGYKTLYGHNTQLLVSVGDVVAKGEKIALSGNTGNSTGPHLHFEVRVNDERVDPQQYLTLA